RRREGRQRGRGRDSGSRPVHVHGRRRRGGGGCLLVRRIGREDRGDPAQLRDQDAGDQPVGSRVARVVQVSTSAHWVKVGAPHGYCGGIDEMRVAFVGSVSVMTGGVWSFGSGAGHCQRVGSSGKQSTASLTPSPSVSARNGSVPFSASAALLRPS